MINWSNEPPADRRGVALPIRRTPAFKPLVAIVTSPDLIGCYTHFFKGHTVPCEKPDCEACTQGLPYRWHSYLSAIDTADGLHFIFECTAQATEAFTAHRNASSTLRGCAFKAQRLNNRPNGRVIIQTKPMDLTERKLPPGADLPACMAIIWALRKGSVSQGKSDPEKDTPRADIDPEDPQSPVAA